jgi:hypothetical protein
MNSRFTRGGNEGNCVPRCFIHALFILCCRSSGLSHHSKMSVANRPLQTRSNAAAASSVLQSLPIRMSSVRAALTPMATWFDPQT